MSGPPGVDAREVQDLVQPQHLKAEVQDKWIWDRQLCLKWLDGSWQSMLQGLAKVFLNRLKRHFGPFCDASICPYAKVICAVPMSMGLPSCKACMPATFASRSHLRVHTWPWNREEQMQHSHGRKQASDCNQLFA